MLSPFHQRFQEHIGVGVYIHGCQRLFVGFFFIFRQCNVWLIWLTSDSQQFCMLQLAYIKSFCVIGLKPITYVDCHWTNVGDADAEDADGRVAAIDQLGTRDLQHLDLLQHIRASHITLRQDHQPAHHHVPRVHRPRHRPAPLGAAPRRAGRQTPAVHPAERGVPETVPHRQGQTQRDARRTAVWVQVDESLWTTNDSWTSRYQSINFPRY